ncbi:MAG: LD-carboxypeptidase [Chitinophagaceae bacterium]
MAKQQPKAIQKGDKVAIVCPAGQMEEMRVQNCVQQLNALGLEVAVGKTVGTKDSYFAGTDKERLDDLQQALDDKNIRAVICGRGGYGTSRIIGQLDLSHFQRHPKWIVGYSDITLLHTHINRHTDIATIHGPMAGAFDSYPDSEYPTTLFPALTGERLKYTSVPHALNRIGKAEGELVGGNLCLLAHSIGSASEPELKEKILFIEDVGEYIYSADRMFLQLKRAGWLDHIKGLVVGTFSDMKDTTLPFGKDIYTVINEHVEEYGFPVAFDFPVGHTERNVALKVGVHHKLNVKEKDVVLKEKK